MSCSSSSPTVIKEPCPRKGNGELELPGVAAAGESMSALPLLKKNGNADGDGDGNRPVLACFGGGDDTAAGEYPSPSLSLQSSALHTLGGNLLSRGTVFIMM